MLDAEQKALLHLLRNPHGWGEETIREARLKAAKELERLWRNEGYVLSELKGLVSKITEEH